MFNQIDGPIAKWADSADETTRLEMWTAILAFFAKWT
jgi:hypothetical protein